MLRCKQQSRGGGLEVVNVLMLHSEPESWLQEYILEVIDDLQE